MELRLSPEDAAFRDEVRAFIADNYPAEMRVPNPETDLSKEQMLLWHRILHKKGWIAPLWPKEYGGPGWSITRRFIFEQETTRAGTLPPLAFSITMVGPVIYTFGNEAQKKKFLPRILSGEDWWCQGYSEPGSGSDLATVRTKAVRDGDHYIVNGHKTWTTLAQHADWIFCLVRTDPNARPQSGISFLLIDMKSPGVTVRPIITIDGSHEVNDVFLENVRVPVENLIGAENKGWTYAKFLLGNERTSMAGIGRSTRYIEKLKKVVKAEIPDDDPAYLEFVRDIAKVELDVLALEATELRVVAQMARGIDPGPAASLFKIRGTEIFQNITELTHRAIGNYGLAIREHPVSANHFMPGPDYGHTASEKYLNSRKLSIYGGSNEIQRLLRDQYDFDARRKTVASEEGFSRQQWQAFAEMGLLAAPFSEDVGGLGGGALSTMIIMQEFGRHLVVEPFVETVVLAGGLLQQAGPGEQRFISDIISGTQVWGLAWT